MKSQNEIRDLIDLAEKDLEKSVEAVEAAKAVLDDSRKRLEWLESLLRDARKRDEKNRVNRARTKAKKVAEQYDIVIDDDSERDRTGYYLRHYIGQPRWLKGRDPIEDGHYSHDWSETLWLVEFYAKHHPSHPDHANRERGVVSPHC